MIRRMGCGGAVWLLLTALNTRVSAQAVPRWYGIGDLGIGNSAGETGFTVSLGGARIWPWLMGAARVDGLFVPFSNRSRCGRSTTWWFDSNSVCDPRVVRVGLMLDVDLVVPTPPPPLFVGLGYRVAGGRSTVIGSAGAFFHVLDRGMNGYVRLTGGSHFFEVSIGAFFSGPG
jgi:hypothetical protein